MTVTSQDDLKYVKLLNADKKTGYVEMGLDIHGLAYILKGLLKRIELYEKMGSLPSDDQISYEYTMQLRDEIEFVRNSALKE